MAPGRLGRTRVDPPPCDGGGSDRVARQPAPNPYSAELPAAGAGPHPGVAYRKIAARALTHSVTACGQTGLEKR
ncbi:hypothetical protein Acsp02_24730 [Actinoplanes sp. NBRC 103695]|nr:hypothetical protein Acsp02_24730 [Actinoplanes sp. NBRC 103695]